MKRILVLGAGGFIGKCLCRELSKRYLVRAFDLFEVKDFIGNENIEMVTGNFVDLRDFGDLLMDVDLVYHLISTTLPNDDTSGIPMEIEQNVIPTVRLLECMVKYNTKEIIFASSAGTIYGDNGNNVNCVNDPLNPICSYGVQKKVIEAYIQFYGLRYGISYKIARLSNPYGLGQDVKKPQGVIPIFINCLLKGKDITIYGDGNSKRDYIYLDDLVEGLISVQNYNGNQHIFNIGYGQIYSLHEIINLIEKLSNMKFSKIHYEAKRFHDVSKTVLDVKSSQEILNWMPKVELETGISIILSRLQNTTD